MFRILDLDNCISDDAWRIPRIDWNRQGDARYQDYHSLAGFDLLGNGDLLATPAALVLLTGRPVMFRPLTEEWLKRQGVHYSILIMRNPGQNLPAPRLKQEMLTWLFAHYGVERWTIERAFDDHVGVVEMYQSFGIPAEVRSIHDVCAYTPPKSYKPREDAQAGGVALAMLAEYNERSRAP